MKQCSVILLTSNGVRRVPAAVARRLHKQRRAQKVAGHRFRLALLEPDSTTTRPSGRSGSRVIHRAVFRFSGSVVPAGMRETGDWFRGFCNDRLLAEFGERWRNACSNHNTHTQPLVAYSVGRDPRVGYLTILAEDHPAAWGIAEALVGCLPGTEAVLTRGWTDVGRVKCLSAQWVTHRSRGCYVGVVAPDESHALAAVPGAVRAELMGIGGRKGVSRTWKVWTRRRANLPLQVGPCASYGAGLLW